MAGTRSSYCGLASADLALRHDASERAASCRAAANIAWKTRPPASARSSSRPSELDRLARVVLGRERVMCHHRHGTNQQTGKAGNGNGQPGRSQSPSGFSVLVDRREESIYSVFGTFSATIGFVDSFGRCWVLCELLGGSPRSGYQLTAAVRTAPTEKCVCTGAAEGAFEGANECILRLG